MFFFLLIFGISSSVQAQNKPLDNWDLEVVGKKALQSETYFDFTKRGPFNRTGASTLLRYGIKKNYELQVSWNGNKADTFFGDITDQSTSIGLKAYLNKESKYLPGFSVIGSFNLTMDPSNNPLMPSLNILFRKGLTSNFKITGNYNFIIDEQSGDLSNDFAVNLDAEFTEWLTAYAGIKGVKTYPVKETKALYQEYVELGMLFWIADGFRLYPYYDIGLGDDSDDIINIGILYHFK